MWGGLSVASAQSPFNIYFGDIHSQTWYSDGNKEKDTNTYRKPVAQAITYARDVAHNMNFLGVSDHNHAGSSDLHMNPGYWRAGNAEADSMNQDGVFVGMRGQEWGVISGGGHVLVYGTDKLFGWEPGNYDVYVAKSNYGMLFDSVKKYGGFCYFAHPQQTDYSGIFSNPFSASWDSVVVGTAMKNGPALDTMHAENDPSSTDYTARYHDLLRLGYHVAPCANQDNHYTNFGNLNQQRTAVLATSLTRANVVDALRKRRTYATEDHNLQLRFEVGSHQMGEIFTLSASIPFRVKVVEPDGDAMSTIELRYGIPGSGSAPTTLTSVSGPDSLVLSQSQPIGSTYYYYAYVREVNGREAWSAPMWITISSNSPPSVFSQLSPVDGSGGQETSGTLSWQASAGADQYDVYLGTDTTFATPVSANQTSTSYSYSNVAYSTTCHWKVIAKNSNGQVAASSAPWSFITHGPPPGVFSMLSPPDGATGRPLSGMFSWSSSPNAVNYDVYLDLASPPVVRVDSNVTDTSYSYQGLSPGSTYHWKVIAKNQYGAASNTFSSFTTANVPLPPSDAVPAAITSTSIQFTWTDNASDENGYRIYRSLSAGGPFVQAGSDLPANSVSFADTGLQVNQRYFYRITPFNDQGEGTFAGFNRATLASPPGQPAVSNISYRALTLAIDPGPNPAPTQFSIMASMDSSQFFVGRDGSLGLTPVWQTYSSWGAGSGIRMTGLHSCHEYGFSVIGRNGDSVSTAAGPLGSQVLPCFSAVRTTMAGWNMVSLPLDLKNPRTSSIFPSGLSKAFSYEGGYVRQDSMRDAVGYWLKFDTSESLTFSGDPLLQDSIPLVSGWNLIGSISTSLDVASIQKAPPDLLISPFFGFDGAYMIADSLQPVRGYWVKAKTSGKLTLSSPAGAQTPMVGKLSGTQTPMAGRSTATGSGSCNTFVFEDKSGHRQALSIAEIMSVEPATEARELPPLPPSEAFDVRFQSQQSEESLPEDPAISRQFTIMLQSGGRAVKLSWQMASTRGRIFRFIQGKNAMTLAATGSLTLPSETRTLILEVQGKQTPSIPTAFALHQNYPNPFNPTTSIEYDLPVASHVTLIVYNLLGTAVSTLEEGLRSAGYHEIRWQPLQASGVYFYRLEATGAENPSVKFQDVKRMVILK